MKNLLDYIFERTFFVKIKHVWHHSDIPQKIVDDLGLMRPEVGIDLIAQVKDGSFGRYNANIIQIKKEMSLTKNLVLFKHY